MEFERDDLSEEQIKSNQEKMTSLLADLDKNSVLLQKEKKNNQYELMINLGKKVTYGQNIQLRHMFSDEFLTLTPNKMSSEYGCVSLSLAELN